MAQITGFYTLWTHLYLSGSEQTPTDKDNASIGNYEFYLIVN